MMMEQYHTKGINEIYNILQTGERGLSKEHAHKMRAINGPNKLPETKSDSYPMIFFRQFQSPLIFVLLLAAAVVFFVGEFLDGFVILAVLFFNAIIGTVQEGRAQNIFAALKDFVKTDATVVRDGEELIISEEEVVIGDLIILREGEKIPADARILEAHSMQVDESAITGESHPNYKTGDVVLRTDAPIAEQKNMIFKGTVVVSGNARAIVVATGAQTFIGGIAQKIAHIEEDLPIKKNIQMLSRFIIIMVVGIGFVLLELGIFYGHDMREILMTIVAVSVSVIPEGLPIVVTLVLATGVWRMGKQNVLIKRLQAVDALGQVNVIAVDKTGTITKNELTVKNVFVGGKFFDVSGVGYESHGEVILNGGEVEPLNHPELLMLGKIGLLCSGAHVARDRKEERWKISGDPLEAATRVFGEKIGYYKTDLENEMPKIGEIPFDYKLKYHATLHREGDRSFMAIIGAPEVVLALSERVWCQAKAAQMTQDDRESLHNVVADLSRRGLRVVACGMKHVTGEHIIEDVVHDIDFIGFLGIEDSPRAEVKDAVGTVRAAGIKLVMITGDHKLTAQTIAKSIGIYTDGDATIEGKDIDHMSERDLSDKIENVSVFARVTPLHKLKIINAYKLKGKTVAMTGDGVNDALSLTTANVGVAMGKIGTEVAKEASDIVLMDDNFGSIVAGVEEGRNIVKTIKRVVLYLLSTGMGEVLTIIGAIVLGFPLPILAVHILWLNLVTDGFLDVALGMEPKKKGLSLRGNEKRSHGLVDHYMVTRMFLMAVPMAIGTLYLFAHYYPMDLSKAWTVTLTTLAVFQWFNAWNCRSQDRSIFLSDPFSNKYLILATGCVIGLQFFAIYNPFMQHFLRTVPLAKEDWMAIVFVAASIIFVEEVRKMIFSGLRILKKRSI